LATCVALITELAYSLIEIASRIFVTFTIQIRNSQRSTLDLQSDGTDQVIHGARNEMSLETFQDEEWCRKQCEKYLKALRAETFELPFFPPGLDVDLFL
jgi:hypothetical protein